MDFKDYAAPDTVTRTHLSIPTKEPVPPAANLDKASIPTYFANRLIKKWAQAMPVDHLSSTFSALADPTRRAILTKLASGATSVAELAAPFQISAPAISKHLKVLENAGLISRSRIAQSRPCKLEVAPLQEVADFLERYRQHWEQSLNRLDVYLKKLQAEEKKNSRKKK